MFQLTPTTSIKVRCRSIENTDIKLNKLSYLFYDNSQFVGLVPVRILYKEASIQVYEVDEALK